MGAVISALDTKQMPTRVGENLHPEFACKTLTHPSRSIAQLE